jgi:hypothetical protein
MLLFHDVSRYRVGHNNLAAIHVPERPRQYNPLQHMYEIVSTYLKSRMDRRRHTSKVLGRNADERPPTDLKLLRQYAAPPLLITRRHRLLPLYHTK